MTWYSLGMKKPLIAVVSFPGNNCEVESIRHIRQAGMEPLFFRWNDDREKLKDVDAYFLIGGFAYEDRGRSGMVAGRDPLMDFIGQEAEAGKAVIGNCNGAQVLVESGLIPLDKGLRMSLAHNAVPATDGFHAPGFISEWVWITRTCDRDRCATSAWDGVMHVPIAHGEGRFVTQDKDLFAELERNGQIAFRYCNAEGNISDQTPVTPNGSTFAAAGMCNPAGNVVALMPHPERSREGGQYFAALKEWLSAEHQLSSANNARAETQREGIPEQNTQLTELFIDTIIVNNEERTVEQTARRFSPSLRLKQWKYVALPQEKVEAALHNLTIFNPHKERAFIRSGGTFSVWNSVQKTSLALSAQEAQKMFEGILLLRRDAPDTGAEAFGKTAQTGVCYACRGIDEAALRNRTLLEVLCNPHSGSLTRISLAAR